MRRPPFSRLGHFLVELKRRHVIRVTGVYAVVGWVMIQVASTIFPVLMLPDWGVRLVVTLFLLGLPVVVVLAWSFDLTSTGVRRTASARRQKRKGPARSSPHPPQPLRTSSLPTTVTVVAVVVVIAFVAGANAWRKVGDPSGLNRERVLVAVFENQTGDAGFDPLGRMTADWITQGLMESGFVQVIDARAVLEAPQLSAADPVRLRSLAEATGAGTIVWGAYYRDGDSIRIKAQITDARDGSLLRAVDPVAAEVNALGPGVEALRQRVLSTLAPVLDNRLASWEASSAHPPGHQRDSSSRDVAGSSGWPEYFSAAGRDRRRGSHDIPDGSIARSRSKTGATLVRDESYAPI